ncbi:MAG: response regulator transcription factor [Hungatella hathewayi]|uniref:response regulator transcription factor n=1 Tax=Hungatella TaxID=1649459 RepID=UPI0011DDCA41|nr:response regulator transcription factor [Hungatella hathewayi]MDU4975619.1 response regulator transcription factor [Hungatella hathewayi]
MNENKILVVEDEKNISRLIEINLTDAGYCCDCVYDGETAARYLEEKNYDLILLDIMLPRVDGYELMEYIRPTDIPVIFLTAKETVEDKVRGLEMGAEDYMTKPFECMELLARVKTVLRRRHRDSGILNLYDLTINTISRTVLKQEQPVKLTEKEYSLLILLAENKNVALYREQIYKRVWGEEYDGDGRTVDIHIQRLRSKTGLGNHIATVYKIGYRLEE